jgi:hypothetical protein
MATKKTPTKKTVTARLKPPAKVAADKTPRPNRVVRQLGRFQTRLERMAARAVVLKDRATNRKNDKAASAHEKAHSVLLDAKQRIEQIAKGVGA